MCRRKAAYPRARPWWGRVTSGCGARRWHRRASCWRARVPSAQITQHPWNGALPRSGPARPVYGDALASFRNTRALIQQRKDLESRTTWGERPGMSVTAHELQRLPPFAAAKTEHAVTRSTTVHAILRTAPEVRCVTAASALALSAADASCVFGSAQIPRHDSAGRTLPRPMRSAPRCAQARRTTTRERTNP